MAAQPYRGRIRQVEQSYDDNDTTYITPLFVKLNMNRARPWGPSLGTLGSHCVLGPAAQGSLVHEREQTMLFPFLSFGYHM